MESISREVIQKIAEYEAQDLSNTAWAYAKLGIVHYKMLAAIASAAIKRIYVFTAQNLTNTVWAFATLVILHEPLLEATSAAARKRCREFCAQNFGNTLWAFAVCAVEDHPLRDAISAEAIKHLANYDLQDLTWLADFDLSCNESLMPLLEHEVAKVWKKLEPCMTNASVVDEKIVGCLRELRVDNLGVIGSRFLLNHIGVLVTGDDFKERAVEIIAKHRIEDPREEPFETKFGGPTRHKRVFSYAEFRVYAKCGGEEPLQGARLQENGARGLYAESSPLKPVQLPINQRVERSACSEFLLLSALCADWEKVGVCDDHARKEMNGTLRLFSTGPSCLSCIVAVWQFKKRYPGIHIEMSYSKIQVSGATRCGLEST